MEIAGVLIIQREYRDRRAFAIGGVYHWATQAGKPSTATNAGNCESRHERSQPNTMMLKGDCKNLERRVSLLNGFYFMAASQGVGPTCRHTYGKHIDNKIRWGTNT
jgi:hypothetical protein